MRVRTWILAVSLAAGLAGCGTASAPPSADRPALPSEVVPLAGNPQAVKKIFVFLDGTGNAAESKTNVRRLFEAVTQAGDPQTTAVYLPGVGTANNPLDVSQDGGLELLVEQALGKSMQPRILAGYRFIAQHHRSGDQVFIFGFSRGAHQARALAGMLAYAGVPDAATSSLTASQAEDVLELVKKQDDASHAAHWTGWVPGTPPPMAAMLRQRLALSMVPVEIQFLGLWDTVPGSSLKSYGDCKEEIGFVKRDLAGLIPGVDKSERYKVESYPVVRRIAHAVSADEKRSKFRQLRVCPPIGAKQPTAIKEVLFPGAHADVGGGYEDSNLLPGLSLNWMVNELTPFYSPPRPLPVFAQDVLGLAHWSIGDSPANKFSDCVDRDLKDVEPHPSISARLAAGKAPLRISGKTQPDAPYPKACRS